MPGPMLRMTFPVTSREDLGKPLNALGLSAEETQERIAKALALGSEHAAKSWQKIFLKFGLWLAFLGAVFFLLRARAITPGRRKALYFTAAVIFGVFLGSDPNPMGTVKDAIALYGAEGVIFPPRIIALGVFILFVVLANKFICSWGCQFGVLQDLIFRLNRDGKDRKALVRQYKIPFAWANGIRIGVFVLFCLFALAWATDFIEPIDPFKIYKPQALGLAGAVFLGAVLIAALFVYRPWCSLACPFGLAGWVFEKLSVFRIRVDYDACTACGSCAKACPSTVMDAILKQDRVVPDCFACGVCIETCPTQAISLAAGRRTPPPDGKFDTPPAE